jgi:hypothetical protein
MSWEIFTTLQTAFQSIVGNDMYLIGLGFMALFLIGFLILGLDLKYSIMFISPMLIGFSDAGWFPGWIGVMTWILIAGFGLYLLWNMLTT